MLKEEKTYKEKLAIINKKKSDRMIVGFTIIFTIYSTMILIVIVTKIFYNIMTEMDNFWVTKKCKNE